MTYGHLISQQRGQIKKFYLQLFFCKSSFNHFVSEKLSMKVNDGGRKPLTKTSPIWDHKCTATTKMGEVFMSGVLPPSFTLRLNFGDRKSSWTLFLSFCIITTFLENLYSWKTLHIYFCILPGVLASTARFMLDFA